MALKEVVLGGVLLSDVIANRHKQQRDAVKCVADEIDKGKELLQKLLDVDSEAKEQAKALAQEALDCFQTAHQVSTIYGITFELPYRDEWGYGNAPFSELLVEDDKPALDWHYGKQSPLRDLYNILCDMECEVAVWNSSSC